MPSPKPKTLNQLYAIWDRKLKKSGFNDIEQRKDENLKIWSSKLPLQHAKEQIYAKTEYYRAAGHFLYDHRFETPVQRRMWELHAQGLSIVSIVKELEKQNIISYKRQVHEIIQALTKIMKYRIEIENLDAG